MRNNKQDNWFVATLVMSYGFVGGVIGFFVRMRLNASEVIGLGNIPEQAIKLGVWTMVGGFFGCGVGLFLLTCGRILHKDSGHGQSGKSTSAGDDAKKTDEASNALK
jgi:hypothetical protein